MAGVAPRITLDFGHLPYLTSANSKILHQHIMVPMQWLMILHCFCSFEVTPVYAMSKITFEMCQANLEHWSSSRTLLRYGKWFDKTGLSNSSLSVNIFKTTPFYLKQAVYKTKRGNVSGSLSPLQWSYHIHSSWKQQLHVNYLTTIYLQLASYTWERLNSHKEQAVHLHATVTKRNPGHLFPQRGNKNHHHTPHRTVKQ